MKNQQSGFTLIELIMVIVILGVLAAVALPRFADFSTDARASSLSGALGAVRSASAIVHSAALIEEKTAADDGAAIPAPQQVTLEGKAINVAYGYATNASIMDAAQLSSEFTITGGKVELGKCSFTYEEATSATSGVTIGTFGGTTGSTDGKFTDC